MAGQHVHPLEDECPRHIGRFADYLGVHQVGKADAAGGDGSGHGYHIHHIHVVHLRFAAVEPEGDNQAQRSAVAGKSLVSRPFPASAGQEVYGEYHLPEMIEVIVGLVEQAVPQPRPDEYAEEAVEEERLELVVAYFLVAVLSAYHEVSQSDAHNPQQAVIADGDAAEEPEEFGIGVPVDGE